MYFLRIDRDSTGTLPIKTAIMCIWYAFNGSPDPNLIQMQAEIPIKTPRIYDSFNDMEIRLWPSDILSN